MIPNIFVSSTIDDLQHLRDAIRDTIREDLAYIPVMSEYGDVGYLPTESAQGSCYLSVKNCQMMIVFIGKRYGSVSPNGFSVTHNEFRAAREHGIPTIAFVDHEVLSFKKVYDVSRENNLRPPFPGMEAPEKTFGFVQEIMDAGTNNAILVFGKVSEARELLKKQLASMFGDLISSRAAPIKGEIKDILSEVMTLRHELSQAQSIDHRFRATIRFLVDDRNDYYRHFIEHTFGPIDTAVRLLLDNPDFASFVEAAGIQLKEFADDAAFSVAEKDALAQHELTYGSTSPWGAPEEPGMAPPAARFVCLRGKKAIVNAEAMAKLKYHHEQLRLSVGEQ